MKVLNNIDFDVHWVVCASRHTIKNIRISKIIQIPANIFLNNSQNLSSKVSMGQVKSNTCFSTHILHRNHYLRVNAHHWVFFTKL